MLLAFLLFTAIFRPAKPTVGDLITIDFQQPVVVNASQSYEIVAQQGRRVVVRTYEPKPFVLTGRSGSTAFSLQIPVRSVLAPGDKMKPAPLAPPKPLPPSRVARIAISLAAAAAILAWAAAWLLERRRRIARQPAFAMTPLERFRTTVDALLARPLPQSWAALADAVRDYLAARGYGADLTTSQLMRALHERSATQDAAGPAGETPAFVPHLDAEVVATIGEVLRQGDLEKFSPWGAPPGDFAALAQRAIAIADAFEPPPETTSEEAA